MNSLEEVMSRSEKGSGRGNLRVELKYCERCGGLWVREGGAGVYCNRCQPIVADLPAPKKKPGKITLPQAKQTVVEEYGPEMSEDDLQGVGGVA